MPSSWRLAALRVGASSGESCRFAPAEAMPSGMPYPSLATERFSPPLRRSTGKARRARRRRAPWSGIIDRDIAQFQADDLVIGAQRGGVQRLSQAQVRPFGQPPPDGAVRAPRSGDPLIPTAPWTNGGNHMLEDHPPGHPAAMAAQRMPWLKLRQLTTAALIEQGAELDPGRAPAGMMARQARDTSMIMDCGKPMIIGFRACALSRHAPTHPYCRAL